VPRKQLVDFQTVNRLPNSDPMFSFIGDYYIFEFRHFQVSF